MRGTPLVKFKNVLIVGAMFSVVTLSMMLIFDIRVDIKNLGYYFKFPHRSHVGSMRPLPDKHFWADKYFLRGVNYHWGQAGMPKDPDLALFWFKKAASYDRPWARYHIANIYWNKEIQAGNNDFTNSEKWAKLAIDQAQYEGYAILAAIEKQRGHNASYLRYLKKGEANSSRTACLMLGSYYEEIGDNNKALFLYKKSMDLGKEAAQKAYYDLLKKQESTTPVNYEDL